MKTYPLLTLFLTTMACDDRETVVPLDARTSDAASSGDHNDASSSRRLERLATHGKYQLASHFTLPAVSTLPGSAGAAVELLNALSTDPGGTLLDQAGAAAVPQYDLLKRQLPQSLVERIAGWITAALLGVTYEGLPVQTHLAGVNDAVRSILLRWDLASALDLNEGTHGPEQLVFLPGAQPIAIPIEVAACTAARGVQGSATWTGAVQVGDPATVRIGEHAIGLPFGRYATLAINAALKRSLGLTTLRTALAALLDCQATARSVAAQCVGSGIAEVCVGHDRDLEASCSGGLNAIIAKIDAEISALDFKALHFEAGVATGRGAVLPRASVAEFQTLAEGSWTVSVNLGEGERPVTATFVGAR